MDISFRSQFTLPTRIDLSIADTSKIRLCLQEICIYVTLDNASQVRFSFLRSLIFYFLASLMAFSGPWKYWNWNFYGFQLRIHLFGWRVFQLQRCPKRNGAGIEIWIQWWRFLLYMDNHFFFIVRINKNQRTSILVHFVGWLFHVLQTLANQWLPNYNINMISSNILLLGSFFSQHRPFDTLWVQLHYTLTP